MVENNKRRKRPMDTPLVKRAYNLGLKAVPNFVGTLTEAQIKYYEDNLSELANAIRRGFVIPEEPKTQVAEAPKPIILTSIGQTFGEWLVAREQIHKFLTEETVILRDMFVVSDELLARTDIMPFFRPAGATNRTALDWKVKLGMNKSYEECDVMKYRNSQGSKVPELHYINRSIRPDENTLGDNAKSPDDLLKVKDTIWTGLYGWSDADNLYSLITGTHLDSGATWTWFPDDRLQGDGRVAVGVCHVYPALAKFGWGYRSFCDPFFGARLAKAISLRS